MKVRKIVRKLDSLLDLSKKVEQKKIKHYLKNGKIPWSKGYHEYKWKQIESAINNEILINNIKLNENIKNYGIALDERIIEYPWILSNLTEDDGFLLDAGSTFNFDVIVNHPILQHKKLFIFTLYPENNNYSSKGLSYIYGDLRDMPFKNDYFEYVICQSTIEHVDMDNQIYGSNKKQNINQNAKSYAYLKVITELIRVLKSKGLLLLTFPYGKFENHGFFQQFDSEMLDKMIHLLCEYGHIEKQFFKYLSNGWQIALQQDCNEAESYNPHTGLGKKDDGAAHSRAICCIKFIKA